MNYWTTLSRQWEGFCLREISILSSIIYKMSEILSKEWIENNAWLIFRADFYPIYTERYWIWLSTDEKLVLSFIHYWTKNWQWIYATNPQIAMLIESSESTAKRCLKSLRDKWLILIEEKKTQTGTDRKLKFNKVLSQFPAQVKNELSAQVKLTRAQGSNWPTEKNNIKKNNIYLSKDKCEINFANNSECDNETKLVNTQTSVDDKQAVPQPLTYEECYKLYYKKNWSKYNEKKCKEAFARLELDEWKAKLLKLDFKFFKWEIKLWIKDKQYRPKFETYIWSFSFDCLDFQGREDVILEKLFKMSKENKNLLDKIKVEIFEDLWQWFELDYMKYFKEHNKVQLVFTK